MAATAIARTQLSHVPTADPAGVAMDATNGNIVPNSGSTMFRLNNTGGSTYTVTFAPSVVVEDFTITHAAYSVAAGAVVFLGKHDVQNFGANILITAQNVAVKLTAFEA
jgi:hypothetical protein